MKHPIKSLAGMFLVLIFATSTFADNILTTQTFDADAVLANEVRVWDSRLDTGWRSTGGWAGNGNVNSNWEVLGGRLENATSNAADHYVAGESPAWIWWTNPDTTSTDTIIEVEFDWGTDGADTLAAHFWAPQSGGTGSNAFITNNQGWANAGSNQNQTSSAGFTPYSLADGSNAPTPGVAGSISGSLNGTGTFTWTVDVSTLGIAGVSTVGDLDTFFLAFGGNETGGGTTWVDNIHVCSVSTAVPEPSALALVGLALSGLILRRRR